MTIVSLSVYNDADLARGALASIREHLPDARIQIVDGRYQTFKPDAPDNSTDGIEALADAFDAEYHAAGPFPLERHKHIRRVELAPDDSQVLLMDADERLIDWTELPSDRAYSPRIFNALVYGPHVVYWPRILPAGPSHHVKTINRWDSYLFDVPHERADAITLIHRHDLRDREYREAKYRRFNREDRRGRYADGFETYLNDEWDADFHRCPECGQETVTHSQVTDCGPEGQMSYVAACVNGDGCYAAVEPVTVGEWRYVPDRIDAGFAEAPERLRVELLDAGCEFLRTVEASYMVDQMRPAVALWLEGRLDGKRVKPQDGMS